MNEEIRTKEEVRAAIAFINENKRLTYSYREDVTLILEWVLGGEEFDGMPNNN